jgi:SMI1 / KNR4 family (SUKH-1)
MAKAKKAPAKQAKSKSAAGVRKSKGASSSSKPATKPMGSKAAAAKSMATKPIGSKAAAAKSTSAKSTGASKSMAPKSTGASKSTPATSTSAKSSAPKSAGAKSAKSTSAKEAGAPKSTLVKSASAKSASAKSASANPISAKSSSAKSKSGPSKSAASSNGIPKSKAGSSRSSGGAKPSRSPVVTILESPDPLSTLREYVEGIADDVTVAQGQVTLGAAQLMLLPIAREARGGRAAKELIDLIVDRWNAFPERTGFHAQEFLRNAFAAVGEDHERIERLVALVPDDASAELRFNIACAYAIAGDKPAMLRALETALAAGTTAPQVRRDTDFDAFAYDADLVALLDRASAMPAIPVDIRPHVEAVQTALDRVVATLREHGQDVELGPPATLDAILAMEQSLRIALPNDYRALLTLHDGMVLWDHAFLGTADHHGDTRLAKHAREFMQQSAEYGATGMEDCVAIANWGQPNNWLLYDPRGRVRGDHPGYVVMLTADDWPQEDLVEALKNLDKLARDVLGTN